MLCSAPKLKGAHDDYPDSLALACYAVELVRGKKAIPKLATGSFTSPIFKAEEEDRISKFFRPTPREMLGNVFIGSK